ncbi:MAG TPA: TolC family protein, partial [Spirochaetia bacterium]|nr:TolC family protein [Spirochaetia bacterium]
MTLRSLLLSGALLMAAATLEADRLTLDALPALVLGHDPQAAISEQTLKVALHTYQGNLSQTLPQIDLSTTYSLGFTPSQESQSTTFTTLFPYLQVADETFTNMGNHALNAKLSVSQILPTAGSLFLSLENTTSASTISSQTIAGAQSNPDNQFAERPKLTIGVTQPIFLNGKVLDLDLFPATIRKAELGYKEQDLATRAQRNLSVAQAVQTYLLVVQLRANVAQTTKSIAVTQGTVAAAEKNYSLGLLAEADLLDARIGLSRQQQGLLELSSSLGRAERALAHLIGRDDLQGMDLSDTVPVVALSVDQDRILDRALANHPLLVQKGMVAEERRLDEVLGGQASASTLSLSFSYAPRYPFSTTVPYMTTFPNSFSDLFASGSGQDYSLSAGLTIHLFDGGKAAQNKAAAQAVSAAAAQS